MVYIAIKTKDGKSVLLTEKILPELSCCSKVSFNREILDFCRILRQMNVDLIEVDSDTSDEVYKLLPDIDFIYRIRSQSDIAKMVCNDLKNCILDFEMADKHRILDELKTLGIKTTVEVKYNKAEDILNIVKVKEIQNTEFIRLEGLKNVSNLELMQAIMQIKDCLKVKVDLCPQNPYYCANAIALEALVNGADSITTSFMGLGGKHGYAATEVVLTAVNSSIYPENKMNLKNLTRLGMIFERVSGYPIPPMQPIIGRDVFKYESGIHADGIEKNPSTYEPFDPNMVGQSRQLVLGKHSGKKAIWIKMKELKVDTMEYDLDYLLIKIREISVQLGRSLNDEELLSLLRSKSVSGF